MKSDLRRTPDFVTKIQIDSCIISIHNKFVTGIAENRTKIKNTVFIK